MSEQTGTCSYCKTEDQPLISPPQLNNLFELLSGIYTPDVKGKTLVEWFKEDWAMFSCMDVAKSNQLLSDILDNGEVVREKVVPSKLCSTDRLHTWGQLKTELMHENRFFPNTQFNDERLTELLSQLLLESSELPLKWFRARIQKECSYSLDKMGAPPKRLASQGRANPAGIPYLYIASTPETAVSEIRPHTGERASVAEFELPDDLNFIDLRDPRVTVSPFILGDEDEIALLRGDIEFLVRLGYELTRPVLPHSAAIDYVPSQYLCEFIKKSGYDGVVYRSSVGEGINMALFDPEKATPSKVIDYQISRVSVSIEVDANTEVASIRTIEHVVTSENNESLSRSPVEENRMEEAATYHKLKGNEAFSYNEEIYCLACFEKGQENAIRPTRDSEKFNCPYCGGLKIFKDDIDETP